MLDMYFNMYKIRFDKLTDLMNINEIDIPYGYCNLFINLEPIIMKLCDPKIDEWLRVSDSNKSFQIISNIINLLAHYRLFFSKHGIRSKIYLYYQQPDNEKQYNQNYIPTYRRNYISKFTNSSNNYILMDTLVNSKSIIKLILEYIDGVYFIDPCGIESSLIPLVIVNDQNDNKYTNFLLSDQVYDFQYVNYGFNILYSRQDNSKIINKSNVFHALSEKTKTDFKSLKPRMLPFILSITGDMFRNIYGIKGIGFAKSVKMLMGAIDSGIITHDMNNINLLIQVIKEDYRGTIRTNYHCVDLASQYNELSPGFLYQITEQLIDKFDNESLKEINDQYFSLHPIQLIELTSKPYSRNDIQF